MSALGELGPTIIAIMWLETLLTAIFISTRAYCRSLLNHVVYGWDDVLLPVSWLLLVLYSAFCTAAATSGFGRRSAELTIDEFSKANKLEIIGQTFCIIGIATSKATVAVFQLRIVTNTWHKVFLWFLMITIAIFAILTAVFDFVQCSPVAHVWNPTIPAVCWMTPQQFATFCIAFSAWSTAVDFGFAALPWFVVWTLQMKRKEKLLICCAMSLGVFAGICGIVRAVALEGLNARSDYTYETVGLILWSSTELMITISTACIPTYRPLWQRVFGGATYGSEYPMDDHNNSKRKSSGFRLNDADRRQHFVQTSTTMANFHEGDDRSDESILMESYTHRGKIQRTDEITVSYGRGEST